MKYLAKRRAWARHTLASLFHLEKRLDRVERAVARRQKRAARPASDLAALYASFGRASARFFARDRKAAAAAAAMELDHPMADLRGTFLLLASGAKDVALLAFGMRPEFATRLVDGLWRPFLATRPDMGVHLAKIPRPCEPFEGCDLGGQWVAFRASGAASAERAFFRPALHDGEALYDAIGAALGYPHDRGFETDCRVEYSHGDGVFVLEYEAHSSNVAAIAAHFLACRAALAPALALEMSVDQVALPARDVAAEAGDARALLRLWRRNGWAPDDRLGVRELGLCRPPGCAGDIDFS